MTRKRLRQLRKSAVLGGLARAKKLSKRRRHEIARNAINARWHPQEALLI